MVAVIEEELRECLDTPKGVAGGWIRRVVVAVKEDHRDMLNAAHIGAKADDRFAERLSENGAHFASGWNFGPADADIKPVSWIADELVGLWGNGASWTLDSDAHPHEAHALKLDATKAATGLGWRPVLPLKQTLAWIAEWYQAFRDSADLRKLTLKQIEEYELLTQN